MWWIVGGLAAPLAGFALGLRVPLRATTWMGALIAGLALLGLALAIANNVRAEADWRFGASPEEAAGRVAALVGFIVGGIALGGFISRFYDRQRASAVAAIAAAALLYAGFGQIWGALAGCLIFAQCGQ